jgi:hypothetical protein
VSIFHMSLTVTFLLQLPHVTPPLAHPTHHHPNLQEAVGLRKRSHLDTPFRFGVIFDWIARPFS